MKHRNYLGHRLSIMGLLPIVFGFSLVFSVLFGNSSVSATSSITITLPSTPISLDVVGATLDGTFAKSDSASFTVSTTNSTGYTLNIKSDISSGNDGSGVLLYNGNDDSYTIPSLGGNGFPTGGINEATYRASSTYKNTWGYQPSMIDSSSNANFLPSPDSIGDTLNVTNCANGTVDTTCTNASDTYSIAIGAKVDSTVRVGSYSNTFVILATANAIPYTIIYDDNTITNMPVDVNTTSQADTVNISSNVPAKDGYTFLGWCDTTPTNTNGVDSCPSGYNVYNPNGNGTNLTYTLNRQSATNNLHLYAMWSSNGGGNFIGVTVSFAGIGIESVVFTNTSNGTTSTFVANQNNAVVNLMPGITYNISMTPGYRFESWSSTSGTLGSTSTMDTTYSTTSNDTLTITGKAVLTMQDMTLSACQVNVGTNGNAANIGDNITVYDKRATSGNNNYSSGDDGDYTVRWINGACWMTQNLRIQGTVSATDSNFDSGSISVSRYDLKTNGSSECGSSNGNNNPCSRVPDSTDMSTIGSGVTAKEVGAWYNYYAASAGTISTNGSTVASSDICPSGWHLPTGAANNTSSEFYKLFQSTATGWMNPNDYLTAFGAVKGGSYGTGSLSDATFGSWWSATANTTTYRYLLSYNSSNGQFNSSGYYRYYGRFVRCIKSS